MDNEQLEGYFAADTLRHMRRIISTILPSVIMGVGIPGNILIIVALHKDSMRDCFLSIYLSSIAFFNILTLLVGVIRHLLIGLTGWDYYNYSPEICFYSYWLLFYCMSAANWTLVIVTGARAFFLWKPQRAMQLFNTKFALSTLLVIHLACLSFHWLLSISRIKTVPVSHYQGRGNQLDGCILTRATTEALLQNLIFAFGPAVFLITLNAFIAHTVWNKLHCVASMAPSLEEGSSLATLSVFSDVLFIVCVIPVALFLTFVRELYDFSSDYEEAEVNLHYTVIVTLLYMNHSMSCVIYCIMGKQFRKAVISSLNFKSDKESLVNDVSKEDSFLFTSV